MSEQAEEDKEVLITLFTKGGQSQNVTDGTECDALLGETLNYGIIDSGCSKSVCGEVWLKCYLDRLSKSDNKLVQVEPGHTYFKFGDGAEIKPTKKVKFPVVIAGKRVYVSCDVISSNIPLLFSKEALKKCDALWIFRMTLLGYLVFRFL